MAFTILFYIGAAGVIAGSVGAVTARSVVHAAVWLMAALLSVSGLIMAAGSPVIGSMVGVAAVSLSLVLLMFSAGFFSTQTRPAVWNNQRIPAVIVAILMCIMLTWVLLMNRGGLISSAVTSLHPQLFSVWLMQTLALPLGLMAMAVLCAIVGVIALKGLDNE
jgi:NADH-quinone oxidoreductase subunit J